MLWRLFICLALGDSNAANTRLGPELLVNPSCEQETVSPVCGWVQPCGIPFTCSSQKESNLQETAPVENVHGERWFQVCKFGDECDKDGLPLQSTLYQDVDVSAFSETIDEGQQEFRIQARFGTYCGQDWTKVAVEFRANDGSILSTVESCPYSGSYDPPKFDEWAEITRAPKGARLVRFRLASFRVIGEPNGIIDGTSLRACQGTGCGKPIPLGNRCVFSAPLFTSWAMYSVKQHCGEMVLIDFVNVQASVQRHVPCTPECLGFIQQMYAAYQYQFAMNTPACPLIKILLPVAIPMVSADVYSHCAGLQPVYQQNSTVMPPPGPRDDPLWSLTQSTISKRIEDVGAGAAITVVSSTDTTELTSTELPVPEGEKRLIARCPEIKAAELTGMVVSAQCRSDPITNGGIVSSCLADIDPEARSIPSDVFYPLFHRWTTNFETKVNAELAGVPGFGYEGCRLAYTEFSMWLQGLVETKDYEACIESVRGVLEGAPLWMYPQGTPFTFWEQYLNLDQHLAQNIGLALAAVAVVLFLFLLDLKPWLILTLVLCCVVAEVIGFMGLLGIKLSAIPAVSCIAAVGISVEFTAHITLAFVSSKGTPKERVCGALGYMLLPVLDGTVSTILGVLLLAFSPFAFVRLYYFGFFVVIVFLSLLNGVVILPVILLLGGGAAYTPTETKTSDAEKPEQNHSPTLASQSVSQKFLPPLFAGLGRRLCTNRIMSGVCLLSTLVVLAVLSSMLQNAEVETRIGELWVESGGRLDKEREYTDKHLGISDDTEMSFELLIQEPEKRGAALSPSALQEHLDLLNAVKEMTVEQNGNPYSWEHVCYRPMAPPKYEILQPYIPCIRATILDCFVEGEFDLPLSRKDVDAFVASSTGDVKAVLDSLGIRGYTHRPSFSAADVDAAAELAGKGKWKHPPGCPGFAEKVEALLWKPDLVLGVGEDRKSADALQTAFVLASPSHLVRQLNAELCLEDAKEVLQKWREKFVDTVIKWSDSKKKSRAVALHSKSIDEVMAIYAEANTPLIAGGYAVMLCYILITLTRCTPGRSRLVSGVFGLGLCLLSTTAALGLSTLAGIKINPVTLQVLPFLALGLCVDDLFVLARSLRLPTRPSSPDAALDTATTAFEDAMRSAGPSVTLTSVANSLAFALASLVPLPAVSHFCQQMAICVAMNYFALIGGFVPALAMDARLAWHPLRAKCSCGRRAQTQSGSSEDQPSSDQSDSEAPFNRWARTKYAPFLCSVKGRAVAGGLFFLLAVLAGVGSSLIKKGLDLSDVTPSDSYIADFLELRFKYFSLWPAVVVSTNFDYTKETNQKAINQTLSEIRALPCVASMSNGWLHELTEYMHDQANNRLGCEKEAVILGNCVNLYLPELNATEPECFRDPQCVGSLTYSSEGEHGHPDKVDIRLKGGKPFQHGLDYGCETCVKHGVGAEQKYCKSP